MGVSKTSDQIKIKIPNPSQECPASSKPPNQDIDLICTLKIKIEIQKSEYVDIKDQWPNPNQNQNPCQEPLASTKAPNQYLKDNDVLCIFKIKRESQNLEHR